MTPLSHGSLNYIIHFIAALKRQSGVLYQIYLSSCFAAAFSPVISGAHAVGWLPAVVCCSSVCDVDACSRGFSQNKGEKIWLWPWYLCGRITQQTGPVAPLESNWDSTTMEKFLFYAQNKMFCKKFQGFGFGVFLSQLWCEQASASHVMGQHLDVGQPPPGGKKQGTSWRVELQHSYTFRSHALGRDWKNEIAGAKKTILHGFTPLGSGSLMLLQYGMQPGLMHLPISPAAVVSGAPESDCINICSLPEQPRPLRTALCHCHLLGNNVV